MFSWTDIAEMLEIVWAVLDQEAWEVLAKACPWKCIDEFMQDKELGHAAT